MPRRTTGGCPSRDEKYGADFILLASCYFAGYPPCPYVKDHKTYIENYLRLPVIIGTHPMPQNYIDAHAKAGDWVGCEEYLKEITNDSAGSQKYDSTRPDYGESLKKR